MWVAWKVCAADIQDGYEIGYFETVVDFVAAKAPSFNKIQQSSTSGLQTVQQQSLKNNKIQQFSTTLGIWFGTRRSVLIRLPAFGMLVPTARGPFSILNLSNAENLMADVRDNFGTIERAEISLIFRVSDTSKSI